MSDGANVHILETKNDTAADVRKALADTVDFINQMHGGHFAGFAIVAWDQFGNGVPISFHGRTSPISDDMAPAYVQTMLLKQNVLMMQAELEDETPATEG